MSVGWSNPPVGSPCLSRNRTFQPDRFSSGGARPPVGLARPHCSRAVRLEQSSGQIVGQPCPSRRRTRLSDKLPPVGLCCPTGLLVGQSSPTTPLLDCLVRCLRVRRVRTRRTYMSDESDLPDIVGLTSSWLSVARCCCRASAIQSIPQVLEGKAPTYVHKYLIGSVTLLRAVVAHVSYQARVARWFQHIISS